MDPSVARHTWQLLEPYHAVVYFDPNVRAIYGSVGLKGYWMGYFASRGAAMGPASPELLTATFYNFHPRMVHRAIPDAWRFSSPKAVISARYKIADNALRRTLSTSSERDIAEAAKIAREIASRCEPQGRPLFAAHSSLAWPDEPHLVLWHAATLWREFRGDGHIAALTVEQIDGCEAHVLAAAAGVVPERQRDYRGWSDDEWADAATRLRRRGLLNEDNLLTDHGEATRTRVEGLTDGLSLRPLEAVTEARVEELHRLLKPLIAQIQEANLVPYPNAMGLAASIPAASRASKPPEAASNEGG